MGIFRRKKKEVEIDTRTKVEKSFEEKGQAIGRKTGKLVQRGLNKVEEVKQKLEQDGTMDKLRDFSNKVDDTIDKVVDKVSKETKKVVKKSKDKKESNEEDYYYE